MQRRIEGVAWRKVERSGRSTTDAVAIEEPLEIRIDDETFATTMRTPGDDVALALGFLLAEGVIHDLSDIGSIAHCGKPQEPRNVIDVRSAPGAKLEFERRLQLTTSACGVCGKRTIESLVARLQPPPSVTIPRSVLQSAPDRLRSEQAVFTATGGLHAAAAFAADGRLLVAREDIGRHNAVDKVVGRLLLSHQSAALLAVSGRASFEIIQKAAAARIPVVASVSAASSLAIDLAAAVRITLAGFVRGTTYNLYTHPERIA